MRHSVCEPPNFSLKGLSWIEASGFFASSPGSDVMSGSALYHRQCQGAAAAGVVRIDVVCPGFAADCLETIEEIDDELRREYLSAFRGKGQPEFHYIDSLNESPEAVRAYASIVRREAAGWL